MKKCFFLLSLAIACFTTKTLHGSPYASGVSLTSGTVTFHLNESVTNGQVYVLFDSGSISNVPSGIPNNGTNVTRGVYSFSLGSHTNYAINVFNTGAGSARQISPNPATTNQYWDYFGPRGVAVNRNPKSPYFGTVYIANANTGTDTIRTTGRGIYAIYADGSDRFGYDATAGPSNLQLGSSTTYGPFRVFVGPDDMVYVSDGSGLSAGTTIGAGVWMCSPDLSTATALFPQNGTTAGPVSALGAVAQGSYSAGTLTVFTIEEQRGSPNQNIWRYNFFDGTGAPISLPWNIATPPDALPVSGNCTGIYGYAPTGPTTTCGNVNAGNCATASVKCGFNMDRNGRFYCVEPRSAGPDRSLWIFDAITNGNCLLYNDFDSVGGGTKNSTFWGAEDVAISDDGQFMIVGTLNTATNYGGTGGKILFTTLNATNANGIGGLPAVPPSALTYNTATASTVQGVCFDSADNYYGVSGSDDSLRAFTPGFTTLTSYGNDTSGTKGSFILSTPSFVNVTASQPVASQNNGSPIAGMFTISRSGSTAQPLTVNFTLTGTAATAPWTTPPSFTASASTSVVIPAGQSSATVTITPSNDSISRPTLTVVLTLQNSPIYVATPPSSATISIVNTGPQLVFASGSVFPGSMYRGHAADYALVTLTRWGDTNPPSGSFTVDNFLYSGTAIQGTDYLGAAQSVTFNPGDVTQVISVSQPVKNTTYTGDKTIIIGVGSGTGYTPGTNTATITVLDNIYPAETVLWSDDLTTDTSANWIIMARNTAGSSTDYAANFGLFLGNEFVGNAPNGASTALKVTCNKNGGLAATGLNLFPAGKTFGNNFAFRFDMNLVQGDTLTTATESALFGINAVGNNVNWLSGSAAGTGSADAVWYAISADGGGAAAGDFFEFTAATLRSAVSGLTYTNAFKHPTVYTSVYTGGGSNPLGVPANSTGLATEWSAVELKQSNNIVTLSIDHVPVYVYSNTTAFTNGTVMLGYDDPFASTGSTGAAYFSNARVVDLGSSVVVAPRITSVTVSGGNVVISFTTTSTSDTTSAFTLQSVGVVNGTFANVSPAANITGGSGSFQATVPVSGTTQFYRILHN